MSRDALHVVDDLALDRGTGRTDGVRIVGHALLADLVAHDPQKWAETSNYGQAARTAIAVYERGWHAQLDRAQLNRLIRTLRRARDTAYGADA